MNREIKFRGKTKDDKWVYGSLLVWENSDCEIIAETCCAECDKISVIHETVGQYTGLKDKNGVEIFEGDVLQLDCFKQGLGAYAKNVVVSYEVLDANDGTQWSWFTLTDSKDKTELAFLRSKNMLVIGNVHDNLELIK